MSAVVSDEEREGAGDFLRALDEQADAWPLAAHVYLVITPLGMQSRSVLAKTLNAMGLRVKARVSVRDWPRVSTALQVKRRDASTLTRAVLFERAWRSLFPDGLAEAWRLDEEAHRVLVDHKSRLRAVLRSLPIEMRRERASLHAFHLADFGRGPHEARRLELALALLGQSRALRAAAAPPSRGRALAPTDG